VRSVEESSKKDITLEQDTIKKFIDEQDKKVYARLEELYQEVKSMKEMTKKETTSGKESVKKIIDDQDAKVYARLESLYQEVNAMKEMVKKDSSSGKESVKKFIEQQDEKVSVRLEDMYAETMKSVDKSIDKQDKKLESRLEEGMQKFREEAESVRDKMVKEIISIKSAFGQTAKKYDDEIKEYRDAEDRKITKLMGDHEKHKELLQKEANNSHRFQLECRKNFEKLDSIMEKLNALEKRFDEMEK